MVLAGGGLRVDVVGVSIGVVDLIFDVEEVLVVFDSHSVLFPEEEMITVLHPILRRFIKLI